MSEENIKVNFVVAGTQKGGTTALDVYLREHSNIQMANTKEVHFFDNEQNFIKEVDYRIYHNSFKPIKPSKLLGEATPIYMYWYDAPRRIWEYNPAMKFIIILRNPVERAFSHWNMERDRNAENVSFSDAISNERMRCAVALPLQHRVYSYIDRGFYSQQLKRLLHFFPKEQLLCIKNEDLKSKPNEVLKEVAYFLNIDSFSLTKSKNIHSREYVSSMSKVEEETLNKEFYFDIKELERILNWDCSDWLGR